MHVLCIVGEIDIRFLYLRVIAIVIILVMRTVLLVQSQALFGYPNHLPVCQENYTPKSVSFPGNFHPLLYRENYTPKCVSFPAAFPCLGIITYSLVSQSANPDFSL